MEVPSEFRDPKVNSRLNFNINVIWSSPQKHQDRFVKVYLKWNIQVCLAVFLLFKFDFCSDCIINWFFKLMQSSPGSFVHYSIITHFCWLSHNSVTKNSMHSLNDFANANICHSNDAEVTFKRYSNSIGSKNRFTWYFRMHN